MGPTRVKSNDFFSRIVLLGSWSYMSPNNYLPSDEKCNWINIHFFIRVSSKKMKIIPKINKWKHEVCSRWNESWNRTHIDINTIKSSTSTAPSLVNIKVIKHYSVHRLVLLVECKFNGAVCSRFFWTKARFVKHGKGAFIYYIINFNRGLSSYCIEFDFRPYLDLNLRGQKFKIAIT